jgi:flagella basal body P-ring formation protein FlgA
MFRIALLTLIAFVSLASGIGRSAEPIAVKLRASATVSGSQVTVGDVAELTGGDERRRERIARLDLTELPLTSEPIFVSQQQIIFRLRLAGVEDGAFQMEGPRLVRVSRRASEALDHRVLSAARQAIEQRLTSPVEDVNIVAAQPVRLPPLSADGEDIHLEAELRSPVAVPGRVMVEVGIYVRGARRLGIPVWLDVKKMQAMPVALRRIEVGETFAADNVRIERIAVENTQRAAVAAAGLMGRRARRPVFPGRIIEPDDVESETQAAAVIHQRDLIHLVAKVGPLEVKARGEALQEGRVGQLIQVRNLDSNATVAGRVVDRATVEVDY